jgi:hypothetical protein
MLVHIQLPTYLYIYQGSIYLSIYPSICLSIYLPASTQVTNQGPEEYKC